MSPNESFLKLSLSDILLRREKNHPALEPSHLFSQLAHSHEKYDDSLRALRHGLHLHTFSAAKVLIFRGCLMFLSSHETRLPPTSQGGFEDREECVFLKLPRGSSWPHPVQYIISKGTMTAA